MSMCISEIALVCCGLSCNGKLEVWWDSESFEEFRIHNESFLLSVSETNDPIESGLVN